MPCGLEDTMPYLVEELPFLRYTPSCPLEGVKHFLSTASETLDQDSSVTQILLFGTTKALISCCFSVFVPIPQEFENKINNVIISRVPGRSAGAGECSVWTVWITECQAGAATHALI